MYSNGVQTMGREIYDVVPELLYHKASFLNGRGGKLSVDLRFRSVSLSLFLSVEKKVEDKL